MQKVNSYLHIYRNVEVNSYLHIYRNVDFFMQSNYIAVWQRKCRLLISSGAYIRMYSRLIFH